MTDTPDPSRPITVIDLPEAVAVFDRVEDLQAAFYDLRTRGFSRHDISLLARQDVLEEKLGRAYWRADDLADDPNAPRAAFVSEDAIGALEGSIAGGFFYVGSMIALAAIVGPASTLAASIAAVAIGGCRRRCWVSCLRAARPNRIRRITPPRSTMAGCCYGCVCATRRMRIWRSRSSGRIRGAT